MTRTAISPRLATSTRENIPTTRRRTSLAMSALKREPALPVPAASPPGPGAARSHVSLQRVQRPPVDGVQLEQELAEFDGLRVLDEDRAHDPVDVGLDLVHELHRLEDAER